MHSASAKQPLALPSATGHRTSMVSKDRLTDQGTITRSVPLWPLLSLPFLLHGVYMSVLRERERRKGKLIYKS